MQGRQRPTSVPTDILRSVVAISETGSISKAARALGISQPAISAQIKRIEEMVGGAVFTKSANGSSSTHLGDLVLVQAKKVLEANQQLLLLRGARPDKRGLRIGLDDLHAGSALKALKKSKLDDVSIVVESSPEIMRGILSGYIDLGLVMMPPYTAPDPALDVLAETPIDMAWGRAQGFTLSPGAPLPLLTWPGHMAHQVMTDALEKQGLIYRIAFSSPSAQLRAEAAEQGLGLTVLPRAQIPSGLVEGRDFYLPPLPRAKLYLCCRTGHSIEWGRVDAALKESFFGTSPSTEHKLAG